MRARKVRDVNRMPDAHLGDEITHKRRMADDGAAVRRGAMWKVDGKHTARDDGTAHDAGRCESRREKQSINQPTNQPISQSSANSWSQRGTKRGEDG